MTVEILIVSTTELLIEEGAEALVEVQERTEILEVARQGPPGLSAYALAVQAGFSGTLDDWLAQSLAVPAGGTTGQLLAKNSDTDWDDEWVDPPTSLPAGGSADDVLTKNSGTDGDASWRPPAATGATPADIANVMAFSADQG